MNDPFGNKILVMINEITSCKLTNNFICSNDLEHNVRAYELMKIPAAEAIEIAKKLITETNRPLKDYLEIVEDIEAHHQICNEIAYTALLLINIPSRNLFMKTFDESLIGNPESVFFQEHNSLNEVFIELGKFPKLPKCTLFYNELGKVFDAITERLEVKE